MNSANFLEFFRFYFVMFIVETIFIFGIYAFFKRFVATYSAAFVLISAFSIGIARTSITTSLGILAGSEIGVAWVYQLFLGGLFELLLVTLWANLNGAYKEHTQIVNELRDTRDSILGYRENAEQILADELEELVERARSALVPQILLIENALIERSGDAADRFLMANEIREVIDLHIRPLAESLKETAKSLRRPPRVEQSQIRSLLSIPKRFVVRDTIFPAQIYLSMLVGYLSTPFWLLDVSWFLPSCLLSISYLATIAGLQKALSKTQKFPAWLGILVLALSAVIAVLPSFLIAVVFYPDLQQACIYGLSLSYLSIISVAIFALRTSFDYQSRGYQENLREQNQTLQHEISIFEQQLWAARRSWLMTIHGSVQSSLTAALTRLSANSIDSETFKLAKRDVESAIDALSKTPAMEIEFDQAINALISTWRGVCEIEIAMQAEAKSRIADDPRLSMCVNEILKEAISNAVRHGAASFALISLEIFEDGILDLTVSNDGHTDPSTTRKGIGSSIMDEFSLSWALDFDQKSGQIKLHARLPFSKAQA